MSTPVEFVQTVNGEEQVVDTVLASTDFTIKLNGDKYSPALVEDLTAENSGDTSAPQDQCGNTQRVRTTREGWTVTVKGIVTDEPREGNLTMSMLRDDVAPRDSVDIRSDIIDGNFVLSNTKISSSSALDSIQLSDTSIGKEAAYDFQLQLGEEDTQ